MKYTFIILLISTATLVFAQNNGSEAGVMVLNGVFQGKSIYLQNPAHEGGSGFCVTKITVNGQEMCAHTGSAYEIGFWCYKNLKIGDPLEIRIEHHKGCQPKVLNPNIVLSRSTFEILDINVNKSGMLSWSTFQEDGSLPYFVEQYRWNKWVRIAEVKGEGVKDTTRYVYDVSSWFHSGENIFRVKQIGYSGRPRASQKVPINPGVAVVTRTPVKIKNDIIFSDSTRYEVYDSYGNYIVKGYGIRINCKSYTKGEYFLNYDNVNEKWLKE